MALNIAKRELDKFNEILSKKNVKANFDDKCIDFVAKREYHKNMELGKFLEL